MKCATLQMAAAAVLGLALGACGDDEAKTDSDAPQDQGASAGGDSGDAASGGTAGSGGDQAGGTAAQPDAQIPDAALETCTAAFRYDPLGDSELTTFPDDFHTVDDAATGTGLRVDTSDAPWRAGVSHALVHVFEDLDKIDGFGVSAGVVLRFTAPVADLPGGVETATTGPVALWSLGETPRRVAFEVKTADAGATIILYPMEPLPAQRLAGVVVDRGLRAADGGCIDPSPTFKSLVAGTADEPRLARLVPKYARLVEASGVAERDLVAGTVFTSQSTTKVSEEVSAAIQGKDYDWKAAPNCRSRNDYDNCEGTAELDDYRTDQTIADSTPDARYDVAFSVWLPKNRTGPVPLIVFGHGLGGDRSNASGLASVLCPEGFAVFATDALGHGEHPTAPPGGDPFGFIKFLGLDIATQQVYPARIRDNFRQSAYDKMQLLRVLDAHPDVDGDGVDDLDMTRVTYWGISLGGIMGPEPLALDPHYSAGILTVAGGRLLDIVAEAPAFGQFRPALTNFVGGPDALARAVPVIQAIVDAGDPVAYAPHVLRDRLAAGGERIPHVLQTMAIGDELVYNPANRIFARALGIPHVPPVFQEVGLITVEDSAPVRANLDGKTAGLFQYDRVRETPGARPVAATHENCVSYEPFNQMFEFLSTWLSEPAPTILDPYSVLMTPPLP